VFEAGFRHRLDFVPFLRYVVPPLIRDVAGVVEDGSWFLVVDFGSPGRVEGGTGGLFLSQRYVLPGDLLGEFSF
jgi:hypothetical protein